MCIYASIVLCPSLLLSLSALSLRTLRAAVQLCASKGSDGGRDGRVVRGPEERAGKCLIIRKTERELRASICPIAFQVGQTSQFSQPQGESVCCVYRLLF